MLVLLPFLKKSLAFTIAMGMLETHFVTFVWLLQNMGAIH
jgi:hypothetical protein